MFRDRLRSWGWRHPFLATLVSCALVIVCAGIAFWWWFGVHLYATLSRSPQAWAHFAVFVAAASLPVLVSIAIAAFVAERHRDRRGAEVDRILLELGILLDRVTQASVGPDAAREFSTGVVLVLAATPRTFPSWARALLTTRLRLAAHGIPGLDLPSSFDSSLAYPPADGR